MPHRLETLVIAALLSLATSATWAFAAQETQPPSESDAALEGLQTGWHTVRPGENLIRITAKYLGTTARWRDNWELNPQIQNPHVIQPGTRIRVILEFESAPPIARLKALSGRVEARPVPIPWNDARVEDLLVERDGLRTHRNSSTELEFQDGTDLVLTEESLVFVRPSRRTVVGPARRSVEIVEGQAELQTVGPVGETPEVEIVVGPATARTRQSGEGRAQTRARKVEDGSAQVMVYAGSSDVEAAGTSLEVAAGMGTAVAPDEPPAPPEKLLPAPALTAPEAGMELRYGDPWLEWVPVAEAASHTLELCRDRKCGELEKRTAGLGESRWRTDNLAEGTYFWRLTAVSHSGLDGYPSEARELRILDSASDTTPPTGSIRLVGNSISNDGVTVYGPDVRVEASMRDLESGIERQGVEVDGRELSGDESDGPWQDGEHIALGYAIDQAGNRGETLPVAFRVDATGPELRIARGGKVLASETLGENSVPSWWCCRSRRWTLRNGGEGALSWNLLGRSSQGEALTGALDRRDVLTRQDLPEDELEIAGGDPIALIFAAGDVRISGERVSVEDSPEDPRRPRSTHGSVLRIEAFDEGTGEVSHLRVGSGDREGSIRIEATDALGNVSRAELTLDRGGPSSTESR